MRQLVIFLLTALTALNLTAGDRIIPQITDTAHAVETQIRVFNPTDTTQTIGLTYFNQQGQEVGAQDVITPADNISLIGYEQLPANTAWVKADDTSPVILSAAYRSAKDKSPWINQGASSVQTSAWRIFAGDVHGQEWLTVVNTGYRDDNISLVVSCLTSGSVLNTTTQTLGRGEQAQFHMVDLFGSDMNLGRDAWIEVSGTEPMAITSFGLSPNDKYLWLRNASALGPEAVIQQIELEGQFTFPEGVAVNSDNGDLYAGGLGDGSIQRMVEGVASYFKTPGQDGLVSVTGMTVDAARNRLWVCNSDFFTLSVAEVVVFDLATGAVLGRFPAPADQNYHFFNDVTLDADGNAYITDSFAPIIFTVDVNLSQINTFLEDASLFQLQNGFNLNGAAVTPDNQYLMVAIPMQAGTTVYRIDLTSKEAVNVQFSGFFAGGDGLTFKNSHELVSVLFEVSKLTFNCDYTQATVTDYPQISPHLDGATTGKIYGDRLYVVNSQLDHLFSGDGLQETFTLTSIPLRELE